MSTSRLKSILWLLPVILVIGYFSRGRSQVEAVARAPAASLPVVQVPAEAAPVRQPRQSSESRKSTGRVVRVADGDTITVLDDAKTQDKVRLDAIDAPELGQPFGQAAKKALSDLVFGREVDRLCEEARQVGQDDRPRPC
jgi:endonuclease YncB( thermonuclease family)